MSDPTDFDLYGPAETRANPQTGVIEHNPRCLPAMHCALCEGTEVLCEECEKHPVSPDCEQGLYCEGCLVNHEERAAELAYESYCDRYWGSDQPVTLEEQCAAAWKEKQELNR